MNCLPVLTLALTTLAVSLSAEFSPGLYLRDANTVVDWKSIGQNQVQFVFSHATIGDSIVYGTFLATWHNLIKFGAIPGAVHNYDSSVSAHQNYAFVEENIFGKVSFSSANTSLFAVEVTRNKGNVTVDVLIEELLMFLRLVESKETLRPIIKTNLAFWRDSVESTSRQYAVGSYRLWIDDYLPGLKPNISATWTDYFIWGFSDRGYVSGIEGSLDLLWMKV